MKQVGSHKKNLLSFDEIIQATGGSVIANECNVTGISSVSLDSRTCKTDSLFIPLRGNFQDGHLYCEKALENGAVCFFVDKLFIETYCAENKTILGKDFVTSLCKKFNAICICVENNLKGLQDCAKFFLGKFKNLFKIAVTGSSGKTTTKELLASIIGMERCVIFSERNLNSETGLPLSVFKIEEQHQVAIFEMGMNRKNEIAELTYVFEPNVAVITNIGMAHIGLLGSRENIALEKKQIFSRFDSNCLGFFPKDEWSSLLSANVKGKLLCIDIEEKKKERFLNLVDCGATGYEFEYEGEKVKYPLAGLHNLSNACLAVSVAEEIDISAESIRRGLEKVNPGFGRTQVVHGAVDYLFDAYNANPQSMEASIKFLAELKFDGVKVALLGSMLELGDFSFESHKKIIDSVETSDIDIAFLYGDEIVNVFNSCAISNKKFFCFYTNENNKLASKLDSIVTEKNKTSKCFVLLKGSRGLTLEQFIPILEKVK